MGDHVVADESDLGDGDRVIADIEGREIAVFNLDGEFVAYLNWCLHQSGPCCEGTITGTMEATWNREELTQSLSYTREGEILNCPWHGWEYDLTTGECLSRKDVTLPQYPVRIEDGQVIVSL